MIRNTTVEVSVRRANKPIIRVLHDNAQAAARDLVEHDNRPLHIDFRWYSRWLRSIDDENLHVYEVDVCVIYAFVEPNHCINPGDLLYYTKADPQQKVLRAMEPTRLDVSVVRSGAIPPIAPPGKTKTFHRQKFFIRWPSVKCPLNQKAEIFNNYWELA